jgi:hypothetical protein
LFVSLRSKPLPSMARQRIFSTRNGSARRVDGLAPLQPFLLLRSQSLKVLEPSKAFLLLMRAAGLPAFANLDYSG